LGLLFFRPARSGTEEASEELVVKALHMQLSEGGGVGQKEYGKISALNWIRSSDEE